LFGVPPSGGPDRLKPGHQTVGSWKAFFRFFRMHWDHEPTPAPPRKGAGRRGPLLGGVRGRFVAVGQWKAFFRVCARIGTMNRSGPNVGQASRRPASAKARAGMPSALPTGQAGRLPYSAVHGKSPHGFDAVHWDHEPSGRSESRLQRVRATRIPPEGGTPNQPGDMDTTPRSRLIDRGETG